MSPTFSCYRRRRRRCLRHPRSRSAGRSDAPFACHGKVERQPGFRIEGDAPSYSPAIRPTDCSCVADALRPASVLPLTGGRRRFSFGEQCWSAAGPPVRLTPMCARAFRSTVSEITSTPDDQAPARASSRPPAGPQRRLRPRPASATARGGHGVRPTDLRAGARRRPPAHR